MGSQVKIVDLPGAEKEDSGTKKPPPSSSRSSRSSNAKKSSTDNDLKSRLHTVFDRIADAAEARGDSELAEVLREDRDVMATGLVSLTRPLAALRTPLLAVLAIIEPVMAFSRIGRLAFGRVLVRRAERATDGMEVPGDPRVN